MTGIAECVAALTDELVDAMPGWNVTRDPQNAVPPCVFVGFPTITAATLDGWLVEVPVHLLAPAPGDLQAGGLLMDGIPQLLGATRTEAAQPVSVEVAAGVSYPGYLVNVVRVAEGD